MPLRLSSPWILVGTRTFVLACLALVVCGATAQAQSPSPVDLPDAANAGESSLGGESTVSSSLVPIVIFSLDDNEDGKKHPTESKPEISQKTPAARLAQVPNRDEDSPPEQHAPVSTPSKPRPEPLSPEEISIRDRVRRTLQEYQGWHLNSREHSPWEIMHSVIAHGVAAKILDGGPRGEPVTAVGWLCYNRPAGGRRLFYLSQSELRTLQGPGLEGHRGQLLAILAQVGVRPDYPIQINGRSFTVADLIEHEKTTCYAGTELTFKLIALNQYLDQEEQWESDRGEMWNIPRLIQEEIAQPIRGAPCGGTHRLSGLSLAVKTRVINDRPLDGEYARAAKYIRDYHAYTFKLQNRDGSMSTEWFRGRGADPDPARRLQTTGHILEWLCYSLPDSEIRSARPRAAVAYLADLMWRHRGRTWDSGPLGHAIHALALYDQRVFRPYDSLDASQSAALPLPPTGQAAPR